MSDIHSLYLLSVFVACQTCRTRKIKCDGLKPICTNCIKKDYAPGPDYQHLIPPEERYKLQNGVCLYDQLPKRRGPDRLPGARVRRKSRADDSGYERGSRHRAPLDSSEGHQGEPSQERSDSVGLPIGRRSPENSYLGSRIGSLNLNVNPNESSFMRASDPLRSYGNSLSLDSARITATKTATNNLPYSERSHGYPPALDLSRISPPNSSSSSDSTRSPVHLYTSTPDRATGGIATNETSIPTGYRPIQPSSEHYVPQGELLRWAAHRLDGFRAGPKQPFIADFPHIVSRIARGRHENQSHARSVAPHDNQAGSYHSTNPYYEYVPSAGAYIQYVPSFP